MIKRSSGVLLHITSMPGEFGIGSFSKDVDFFLTLMRDMGFTWWQVLPLSCIGAGNSPYSGVSAFALNYLFVDPVLLHEQELITFEEMNESKYQESQYTVNYDFVKASKKSVLLKAYQRIDEKIKDELDEFFNLNNEWLTDYAVFMTLKDANKGLAWWEWKPEYKFYNDFNLSRYIKMNYKAVYYYVFEQYILQNQWKRIQAYAHTIGMGIIGDLPIYVSLDSVDVWANTDNFQLDKNLAPIKVAGVPPDYFSSEGQLWGNPLYDYKKMEKNNYDWFIKRFTRMFELYDGMRIDHFRGFCQYWSVDSKAKNAIEGSWENGPQMKLFDIVKKEFKNKFIIAEDLGIIDDKTRKFLKETGFPGMKVMQFAFSDEESTHLPHNYPINCVCYTATHDNDTTLGWLYKQNENIRDYALKYCNYEGIGWGTGGGSCKSTQAFIKTLIASSAALAIVPVQDLCGYGSDTRLNVPGIAEGNWIYRATYSALGDIDRKFIRGINDLYGRFATYTEKNKE